MTSRPRPNPLALLGCLGLLAAVGPWLAGCATRPPDFMASQDRRVRLCPPDETAPAEPEVVELVYLGVGGVVLRRDGAALMTAPFYSHPSVLRVGLGLRIEPDAERIRRGLPRIDDVRAILVGHGHYDHLLDVPLVLEQAAPGAIVYGNETSTRLLEPWLPPERRIALNGRMGSWRAPGDWIRVEGTPFRFMALASGHAPQFAEVDLYDGPVDEDPGPPPWPARHWKSGQPLAFLIDVLGDDGEVILRVHYQDAASDPPSGFPPPDEATGDRRVDVAILTVGAFASAEDYPAAIVTRLEPRHALLAHWEDFFTDPAAGPRTVRATDVDDFVSQLETALPEDASWTLARPGVALTLETCVGRPTPARGW